PPLIAAQAPSSWAGSPLRSNVCSGWSEKRRSCGSSAASGVAPETCPTQPRPGARHRATSEMAVSGTQMTTTSGSEPSTATPRSRRRAAMAEPTRPEPMTWTLSITISLQLRGGCRAPWIVLVCDGAADGDTCEDKVARMSSAAASLADIRRLSPRRELLLGAALTAAFAALVLAVARLRRARCGADVHRAVRVLARLHGDARDAQAAAAPAAPPSGGRGRADRRLQPARVRLPLPRRRVVRRLAPADRAPAPLVRRRSRPRS